MPNPPELPCLPVLRPTNVLHCNLAKTTGEGDRFVVTAYCGGPIARNAGLL